MFRAHPATMTAAQPASITEENRFDLGWFLAKFGQQIGGVAGRRRIMERGIHQSPQVVTQMYNSFRLRGAQWNLGMRDDCHRIRFGGFNSEHLSAFIAHLLGRLNKPFMLQASLFVELRLPDGSLNHHALAIVTDAVRNAVSWQWHMTNRAAVERLGCCGVTKLRLFQSARNRIACRLSSRHLHIG